MHALICFIFATLTCVIMAKPSPTLIPNDDPLWREYKLRFKKFYEDPNEEVGRYVIWLEHNKEIDAHNSDPSQTYKRGINHFSDMSHVEFHAKNSGCLKVPKHILEGNATDGTHWVRPSNVDIPETVDWRTAGLVTPIKNQGQCGSCWAFSSTGSLEGQIFKKTGRLPSLSEQNLVDCTQKYGNEGCRGGWYENSFKYIRDNKGIDSETGYPYYARELGYCYYNAQYNTASDTGFVDLPANDENALKEAVATIGPISVAIDATRPGFASYRSGVYVDASCGNTIYNLDHAVLVVGYGTENGVDYWLVKNSWGTYWGDAGYIKMARNRNNQCGIACKASYPLV